jgi:hypothetical protein
MKPKNGRSPIFARRAIPDGINWLRQQLIKRNNPSRALLEPQKGHGFKSAMIATKPQLPRNYSPRISLINRRSHS